MFYHIKTKKKFIFLGQTTSTESDHRVSKVPQTYQGAMYSFVSSTSCVLKRLHVSDLWRVLRE